MPENRFDNVLRDNHEIIADFSHGNCALRVICALEIKKIIQSEGKQHILEIGCGDGYFTKYILKYNLGVINALDISPKMLEEAKINLAELSEYVNFICKDALVFLQNTAQSYDIITSSWTIHNFTWDEKIKLFEKIHKRLNKRGKLFLLDKIYTDDFKKSKKRFNLICKRHSKYLPMEVREEMLAHTKRDFTNNYRMEETALKKCLKKVGLKGIKILDREADEALLIASA